MNVYAVCISYYLEDFEVNISAHPYDLLVFLFLQVILPNVEFLNLMCKLLIHAESATLF